MDRGSMNADARRENIRALAAAAGLSEEEAASRLKQIVLITFDKDDDVAARFVEEIIPLLSRTLEVECNGTIAGVSYAGELVIGQVAARTSGSRVFAMISQDRCIIGSEYVEPENWVNSLPHPLKLQLAACYVAGAAIRCAVGDGLRIAQMNDFVVPFDSYIPPSFDLLTDVELGEAYLAGAGAIGNGFLWAARHISLKGHLHVVDDDTVSPGNLQRQIWFEDSDIGKAKAKALCAKAQSFFPDCFLDPATIRLQEHKNQSEGPWLRRLIVAVDSRRARRHLQNELPGEVFDASTTGSEEIVLHYNKQPTRDACLECIYYRNENEFTHEDEVASHLGVDVELVRTERIDGATARRICESHPQLSPENIEGLAFDTLYKQLCSSGQLKSVGGKQVIAPFAFISVLAGVLLLIELIRRQGTTDKEFTNDWRINPWQAPVPEMRQRRPRLSACEWCGRREIQLANTTLWRH